MGRIKRHACRFHQCGRLFDLEGWAKARKKVVDAVMQLHKKDPGIPFLPLSSVRAALARFEPTAFDAVLDALLASGDLKRTPEGGVAWKTHTGDMPAIERERGNKLLAILAAAKASPPEESELGALAGLAIREAKRTLFLLESRKEVFHAGTFWFHGAWVADAQRALAALAKAKGGAFTASEAREKLGMTRKYIIPLLEALDDKGFTKRMGDTRSIR